MKILFVCHRLPYPPNRGGKIRPFNMIRHLSERHTVVVGSVAHTMQELQQGADLSKHCEEVLAEVVPNTQRWRQAALSLVGPHPSSVAYFRSARLQQRIADAARRYKFDVVIVHCAFAAQYGLDVAARFRLMDFGDLDSGKWSDYRSFRVAPVCYGYGIEAIKLRRYEKHLMEKFDFCTVTTSGELEELKKINDNVPSAVIPNGVDNKYFSPAANLPNGRVIVLVGRMDYFPNIDAAEYFAREIFPIVRSRIPDATLRLVGSDPTQSVRDLAMLPGVTVTGHVPDVRPYALDATMTVAPLRLARGTQNKILESMAMGVPVVATSVAAKGVAATPGQHLLVADDRDSFAAEVIRMFEDKPLRESLAVSARKQVESEHSWARSMEKLDAILERFSTNDDVPVDRHTDAQLRRANTGM